MRKKLILILLTIITISKLNSPALCDNVTIEAEKQNYNGQNNLMTFEGKVKVNINNISVKSPKAFLKTDSNGKPEIATFVQGAEATQNTAESKSSVKANIIRVSLLENNIKAEGNADTIILEKEKPVLTIKSSSQEFDMTNRVITASGNVSINYQDLTATSSVAKILVDDAGKPSQVYLTGSAKLVQDKNIINASNFVFNPTTNTLVASGNVKSHTMLDDATEVLVNSDHQEYDKATSTLITSGRVKIVYKDYVATGPKAAFLPGEKTNKPNKIVFLGRSRIKEGDRLVEADRLEITINPKNFTAQGNVRSKFSQVQGMKKNEKKPEPKTSSSKTVYELPVAQKDEEQIKTLENQNINSNKSSESMPAINKMPEKPKENN